MTDVKAQDIEAFVRTFDELGWESTHVVFDGLEIYLSKNPADRGRGQNKNCNQQTQASRRLAFRQRGYVARHLSPSIPEMHLGLETRPGAQHTVRHAKAFETPPKVGVRQLSPPRGRLRAPNRRLPM